MYIYFYNNVSAVVCLLTTFNCPRGDISLWLLSTDRFMELLPLSGEKRPLSKSSQASSYSCETTSVTAAAAAACMVVLDIRNSTSASLLQRLMRISGRHLQPAEGGVYGVEAFIGGLLEERFKLHGFGYAWTRTDLIELDHGRIRLESN